MEEKPVECLSEGAENSQMGMNPKKDEVQSEGGIVQDEWTLKNDHLSLILIFDIYLLILLEIVYR